MQAYFRCERIDVMKSPATNPAGIEIVALRQGDEGRVAAAATLFDRRPKGEFIERFLRESTHHLLIAYIHGEPAGFVTGIEMTHPDKGTEMFLYELAVDEDHRQRGVGSSLVDHLAALAREQGCYGMWVLTENDNPAALRTYVKVGGRREKVDQVMLEWKFE